MVNRIAFKPAVRRRWLLALAGLLWSVVGLGLCRAAWLWFAGLPAVQGIPLAFLGIGGAVAAWRFLFSAIARKNIDRLNRLSERPCLFAFQTWKSYFLIVFMVCLGVAMRHFPVPGSWLAVVYTAIGGALVLASGRYYKSLLVRPAGAPPAS